MNKRERAVIVDILSDDLLRDRDWETNRVIEKLEGLLGRKSGQQSVTPIVIPFSYKKREGSAKPKPKRLVSRKNIEAYKKAHPVCEVCGAEPMRDPHHLLAVSLGGSDIPENLIRLCFEHHVGNSGFHTLGMYRWFEIVKKHVDMPTLDKILYRLALGKKVSDLE